MSRDSNKKKATGRKSASWLITFSDLMTLLLTFFVLLVSMAALKDERKTHLALGSISQTFGIGKQTMSLIGLQESKLKKLMEPGPFQNRKDLQPMRKLPLEDLSRDLEFISNAFVQILSINASVLFPPGQDNLTEEGRNLLQRILPYLQDLDFPFLIAGHTSTAADEQNSFLVSQTADKAMTHWRLSLNRAMNVYLYLKEIGISPDKMQIEAYGKHRPRYSNTKAKGRRKNRRVEIIVDKRNYFAHSANKLKQYPAGIKRGEDDYQYKGFDFRLDNYQQNATR